MQKALRFHSWSDERGGVEERCYGCYCHQKLTEIYICIVAVAIVIIVVTLGHRK